MKTEHLEVRPVNVRLESRTRGHAFVVMLAYRLTQELAQRWGHLNISVQEWLNKLATLCTNKIIINGKPHYHQIPQPLETSQALLKAAGVTLPKTLPIKGVNVTTKKKLQKQRIIC